MTTATHPLLAPRGGANAIAHDVVLPVGGMTCAACQGHVERALTSVPGVRGAVVNLVTRSARVTLGGDVDPDALIAAVEAAGYHAELPRDDEDVVATQLRDDAERAREVRGKALRAALSLAGMVAVMVVPMWWSPPGPAAEHAGHAMTAAALAELRLLGGALIAFTLMVALTAGWPIVSRGVRSLGRRQPDMNALVVLGATAALALSVAAVALPARFGGLHGLYVEAVLGILGFVLLGNALEAHARRRTTSALTALARLAPADARVEDPGGGERAVDTAMVRKGDVLIIKPGERVAADATILDGASELDESMITGESVPVVRQPGDRIVGGTINGSGRLRARVTAIGAGSTLSRLVRLLRDAQATRAPMQQLADRLSARFVPAALALALLVFAGWWLLGGDVVVAARHAAAVLVIACPCALGLAVPTAVLVASGRAAAAGALVKGGDVFERLASARTVAFDKTGTLTQGKPEVSAVVTADAEPEPLEPEPLEPEPLRMPRASGAATSRGATVLRLAAAVEQGSEHPLAHAVLAAATARGLAIPQATDIAARPGQGIVGVVDGALVAVGNVALAVAHGVPEADAAALADRVAASGATPALVVRVDAERGHEHGHEHEHEHGHGHGHEHGHGHGHEHERERDKTRSAELLGALAITDALRPDAAAAVAALRARGLHVTLLTGDRPEPAARVAGAVGIDDVVAGVDPAGKVTRVRALAGEGGVIMVGDGINDAPALAAATVGVAQAGGTDVAGAAAHVALLRPELGALAALVDVARAAVRTMRRNLAWAAGYNLIAIPLAAGALTPWGIEVSPMVASALMATSSVSVVVSSLFLGGTRR